MKSNNTCVHCGKPIKWYDGWQLWASIPQGGMEDTVTDLMCGKNTKLMWGIVGSEPTTPGHESKEERVIEILNKIDEVG